jgi:hypothetical protein
MWWVLSPSISQFISRTWNYFKLPSLIPSIAVLLQISPMVDSSGYCYLHFIILYYKQELLWVYSNIPDHTGIILYRGVWLSHHKFHSSSDRCRFSYSIFFTSLLYFFLFFLRAASGAVHFVGIYLFSSLRQTCAHSNLLFVQFTCVYIFKYTYFSSLESIRLYLLYTHRMSVQYLTRHAEVHCELQWNRRKSKCTHVRICRRLVEHCVPWVTSVRKYMLKL